MTLGFEEGSLFLTPHGRNTKSGTFAEPFAQRMYERHKRIIQANLDQIEGKTILDLASNDGRWTWAALQAKAAYGLGIEGRQELIDNGLPGFRDIDSERFDFRQGDVYDSLHIAESLKRTHFDTVLCLGLFYHISDHYRLFRIMRAFNPHCIIIDSTFRRAAMPMVKFKLEDANDPSMGVEEGTTGKAIAGQASIGLLQLMADISGYDLDFIPWLHEETEYPDSVKGYLDQSRADQRMTARLIAREDKPTWTTA